MKMKPKVLLHICCAVCAGYCVQRLRDDGFETKGFFYNPNIYPQQEYEKRLKEVRNVSEIVGFELIEGYYDKDDWFRLTEEFKDEYEGGKRCGICFKMRIAKTNDKAKDLNIPLFTTTLTVSPHKNACVINEIGKGLNPGSFLEYDFKKKDGFKKTMEFAKKFNLYCQHYCGCIYSMKEGLREGARGK